MTATLDLESGLDSAVGLYDFQGLAVRLSVDERGEPWFVAADVAAVLGLGRHQDSTRYLDDDERGVCPVDTPSGRQQMTVISESGLYGLILRSRRPEAKQFRRWVTGEVLPAIRRTGRYAPARHEIPATLPEALRLAAEAIEERDAAEQRAVAAETEVQVLAPAAEAWRGVADAEGDFSLREAAQMLCRAGVETGQNRLAEWLRDLGWTDRWNRPYQSQVDLGRLATRTRTYPHPRTGVEMVTTQVRVTAKGIARLVELHKEVAA